MTQDELVSRYPNFKLAVDAAPGILEQLFEDLPASLHSELDKLLFETAALFEKWHSFGKKVRGQAGFLM